ncbi:hypothetical protein SAMN02194393_03573 [Maledivibacter halophilus]|uniref:Uncharacterized protein n=1 Tax=Maledivibacter halophilus TaxID=36842 RepID=A0A1T5LYY1_9FIRM|nr:hypothetical protein SAMN02194393_03573 [Maledivibacter halophilus]
MKFNFKKAILSNDKMAFIIYYLCVTYDALFVSFIMVSNVPDITTAIIDQTNTPAVFKFDFSIPIDFCHFN